MLSFTKRNFTLGTIMICTASFLLYSSNSLALASRYINLRTDERVRHISHPQSVTSNTLYTIYRESGAGVTSGLVCTSELELEL